MKTNLEEFKIQVLEDLDPLSETQLSQIKGGGVPCMCKGCNATEALMIMPCICNAGESKLAPPTCICKSEYVACPKDIVIRPCVNNTFTQIVAGLNFE